MMDWLRKQIARELRNLANKFDANTTEISETQAMDIMSMLTHEVMSKEQACNYLNLSRSRFDDLVREKKIPEGRKRVGFKEKVWWRDELDLCKKK
jgi:predicted XRE-type DNA-binding protein